MPPKQKSRAAGRAKEISRSQIIKITVRSQLPVMKDFKIVGRPMSAEATWQDFFDSVKFPFDKNNHKMLTSRYAPRVNEPIKNTSKHFKKLGVIIKVVKIGEEDVAEGSEPEPMGGMDASGADTDSDSEPGDYTTRKLNFLRAAESVSNAQIDAMYNEIRALRQLNNSNNFRWNSKAPLLSGFAVAWADRC